MLDILNKIRQNPKNNLSFNIIVCHVNHMIRKEAEEDETYVINFCKKNNIEYYIKRIDVQKYANNKKVGTIKKYVYRSIVELSNGSLEKKEEEMKLIDRNTGREYPNDIYIKDTNIRNGSKVILL